MALYIDHIIVSSSSVRVVVCICLGIDKLLIPSCTCLCISVRFPLITLAMIGPASQRLAGTRQRLQRKLITKLSSSSAVVPHIRTLHSSTSSLPLVSITRPDTTTLPSPCTPLPSSLASTCRRSFAKAAAKGKEKDAEPKPTAAKLVRTVTKPPHPSSLPRYPPPNRHIPHPASSTSLAALNPAEPISYDVNDPVFRLPDPHTGPSLHQLRHTAERYDWIDWSRYRDYLHRSDIHFFDNEVKQTDQNFYPYQPEETDEPDEEEEADRAEQLAVTRLARLLPFSAFIDKGSTTRVTRFGKVRSAWAMLLAGDRNGTASFGIGKGEDFGQAMKRAERDLRNNLTFLPLLESRTILNETVGRFGVCEVHMKPLPRGGGMTAGIIPRLVFEAFGLHDISAKVYGRALPKHQIFAIWDGLSRQRSMREWTVGRGIRAHRMFERGVQQPRAPPRAVLEERAEAIHRKLQEAQMVLEDEQDTDGEAARKEAEEEDRQADREEREDADDEEERRIATLGKVGPDGRVIDMDDIMDGPEAKELDKDRLNWGPWLYSPSYVPVLPPAQPVVPSPRPASPYGIQRGKNVWKK